MNYYKISRLKWYHVLFGIIGFVVVAGVVLYFMFGRKQVGKIVEDETDIVTS